MTLIECPRESDVLDAVAAGKWPNRVEFELAEHVASCRVCADVLTVATAIQSDHDAVWQDANIPSSGQVWWRAEMRVRQEAVRQASRPIAIVQAAAVIVALVLAVGTGWIAWTWSGRQFFRFDIPAVSMQTLTSPLALSLIVAVCALVVITPVALYFVLSDE